MKLLSAIGSLLSGISDLFRGRDPFELDKRELEKRPYINKQEAIAEARTHVYRGGRHSRSSIECPACFRNTSKRGLCLNRMCRKFNAKTARTHPDLLSLRRARREAAITRWARGGKAALWAT